MTVAVITGSSGLIGSEAAVFFGGLGFDVVGIDNDMRSVFFGAGRLDARGTGGASSRTLGAALRHHDLDIRDRDAILALFRRYGAAIELVIHTAAQPSHDWAAREPFTDFDINAVGTLNLLEATRLHAPEAPFIFTSTNKVYGDTPNSLPLVELDDALGDRARPHVLRAASARTCRSTARCTASSARRRSRPTSSCRSTGATSGCATACFRGGTLTGPQPLGRRAARLPRLRHALRDDRPRRTRCSATRASRCATRSTATT